MPAKAMPVHSCPLGVYLYPVLHECNEQQMGNDGWRECTTVETPGETLFSFLSPPPGTANSRHATNSGTMLVFFIDITFT